MIASILNRNGDRTPHGERWTARSICSLRNRYEITVYLAGEGSSRSELTVEAAARMLKVTATTVLKWIRSRQLPATQLCPHAPWVLNQIEVESFKARQTNTLPSSSENAAQLGLTLH
jgi:hypothetical protein